MYNLVIIWEFEFIVLHSNTPDIIYYQCVCCSLMDIWGCIWGIAVTNHDVVWVHGRKF